MGQKCLKLKLRSAFINLKLIFICTQILCYKNQGIHWYPCHPTFLWKINFTLVWRLISALIWDISGQWNRSNGRDFREKLIDISRFLALYIPFVDHLWVVSPVLRVLEQLKYLNFQQSFHVVQLGRPTHWASFYKLGGKWICKEKKRFSMLSWPPYFLSFALYKVSFSIVI